MTTAPSPEQHPKASGVSGIKLFFIVFGAVILAILLGAWAVKTWIFPDRFKPVELSAKEEQKLDRKIKALGFETEARSGSGSTNEDATRLKPEAYSEAGAERTVSFSEREVNSLLANNTELAEKLAIDFSDNLASAKLLIPLDPDFPVMGGQTLKLSAGITMGFDNGRPVIAIKGLSLWGVPLPNAWLGGLKNVDLVEQFGVDPGFWQAFADGVESLTVEQGKLTIKLKE